MSENSNPDGSADPDPQIASERDRMIGSVMNAIATALDGLEGDRITAVNAILDLEIKKQNRGNNFLPWEKSAATLALEEIGLFFVELGINLLYVEYEVLRNNQALDESIVHKIKEAADAWARLGRIGD